MFKNYDFITVKFYSLAILKAPPMLSTAWTVLACWMRAQQPQQYTVRQSVQAPPLSICQWHARTVVSHDDGREKILTSSPLASLTILRFWQRQYKFKHGTNIDRHPFKQSVWPAFAAVWPEIEIIGHWLLINIRSIVKLDSLFQINYEMVVIILYSSALKIGHFKLL